MAVLPEDMSIAIDELESAIAEIESRLETTRAERDEAKGRQVELEIENANLRRELILARERQSASAEILAAIAITEGDAEHALQQIAETAQRFFDASSVTIRITDGKEWIRTIRVGRGSERVMAAVPASELAVHGKNVAGLVYRENRQVHVPDIDHVDASIADFPGLAPARAGGSRTVSGTPLRLGAGAIGAMIIHRDRLAPFTDDELALQQSFADQAVIAIENARLFNDTREALEQQTATSEILRVINNSGGDLAPVFDCILENAHRLCGAPCGSLQLYESDRVVPVAIRGMTPAFTEFLRAGYPITDGIREGLLADHPIQTADLVEAPRSRGDEPSLRAAVELGRIRSMITVPLAKDGVTFGRIVAARQEVRPFEDKQTALLQSFAAQAVIAIENARLFNETKEALERQTATAEILKVIAGSPSDVQPVFDAIADSANRLIGGFSTAVFRFIDGAVHLTAFTPINPAADQVLKSSFPQSLSGYPPLAIIQSGETVQIVDTEALLDVQRDIARARGFRSVMISPLMSNGVAIGSINVTRADPGAFAPHHVQLLQTFADQAVIAIENARLFNETKEALERQTATADILKVIASSPSDVQPVFDAIAASSKRLLGGFSTTVFRLIDGVLHLVAFTPTNARADSALTAMFPRPIADFPPFTMISDGRMSRIEDTESDAGVPPMLRDVARLRGYRAMLLTPLMREGSVLGMISVTREKPGAWAAHHADLLRTFADQAVIAIENARLFNEVQQRTEDLSEALQQQTATADVLKLISRSAFDLQSVLNTLTESAARLCNADMGAIALRDERGFYHATNYNFPVDWVKITDTIRLQPDRSSLIGRTLLASAPVQIEDVVADPEYMFPDMQRAAGYRSLLGVPLMRGGEPIGVLFLGRKVVEPYTEKQVELVSTFADQAVIAIENVRLFDEVQTRTEELSESLQQQTAVGDVLKTISRSTFDLQPVLDTLVNTAALLCNADMAFIMRRVGDEYRAGAAVGYTEAYIDFLTNHPLAVDRGTVTGRAVIERRPVQILDVAADPEYTLHQTTSLAGQRTTLGVPLLREDEPIGVIVLARQRVEAFTQKQIDLVTTFADQAVIAIENVRLFDELRQRTDDLSEALRQQTATADVLKVISRSAFDLKTVLDALLTSACHLCNADIGTIRYREDGDFRLAATFGCPPEWVDQFSKYSTKADRGTVFGRTIIDGHTIHIPDVLADPDFKRLDAQRLMGFRAALGVPLTREGQVFGVINLFRFTVSSFEDRQIDLVQTFADQAVIAIENVRLFDEVQAKTRDIEEALRQQTATGDVLKVIASSPTDVQPALQAIVKSACIFCGAYDAGVLLKVGNDLHFSAHHGPIPSGGQPRPISREWVVGRSVIDKVPVQVSDFEAPEAAEFPEGRRQSREQGHRCTLSVPLLREGEAIGAIALRRLEPVGFTDKQIALLQTFADQAVIAIGNVRLFDEVQAKTRDLSEALEFQTATGDVLNVISRSPNNLQPVMDTIVETAQRLCGSEYALIMQRRDGFYRMVAHANASRELLDWLHENPVSAGDGSAVGIVAVEKKTLHLHDALADCRFTDLGRQRVSRARTMLAVPLLHEDDMIGVVFLARTDVKPFSDRQVELVTSFADQAVIAISNVKLFEEVQQRTRELTKSLDDLRTAQDRLVQTEKLASLGQLTAGIAHEIKNPLNFVNNFAALSAELTEELNEVLKPAGIGDKLRAEVNELTGLLKDNLEKVVQHGKRADSIVKNMLLHSREGGGEHRPSDINALLDESLNLAYHGARAERPDFNVTIERDFDPEAGQIDLFPQEITRVVLNLVSNGFHAVTKRRKEGGGPGFEPKLRASTKTLGEAVEIRIRDNGTGIPPEVKEKMFNPFFTTKPAGEGTGLGLSMSHDIIVKQHGGTIDVDTQEGVFTEFRIVLPRTSNFADKSRG